MHHIQHQCEEKGLNRNANAQTLVSTTLLLLSTVHFGIHSLHMRQAEILAWVQELNCNANSAHLKPSAHSDCIYYSTTLGMGKDIVAIANR